MTAEVTSPLVRQVDLAFPAAKVNSEVDVRLRRMARTVRMPGFRPGKVPLKLVAQQYGGQVRQEVVADGIRDAFAEKVKEHNYRVAGLPRFEPKEGAEADDRFEFVAKFEVYPEVNPGDVSQFTIKRPVVDISDADLDRTVEILRKQRAHFHTAQRAAAKGDRVRIDYRGTIDGVEFEGGSATDQLIGLGDGRLLKDFEDGIVGMTAGDTKRVNVAFPEDYHGKAVAGKKAEFEISVKEVQEEHLPALDANFAKALGVKDGDLAKMRDEIRGNLQREVKNRIQSRVKDQMMQALLDSTPIAAPQSLISMEAARMRESMLEDFRQRGTKVEGGQLPPELFNEQATRRVTLGLIVAELIRREKLEATADQVRARVQEHAQTYEQPDELVKWYYTQQDRMREVEAVVAEDNLVQWILSKAKVEDVATPFEELMGTKQS